MSMGRSLPTFGLGTGGGGRPAASATGPPACAEVVRGKGFSQGDLHGKAGRATARRPRHTPFAVEGGPPRPMVMVRGMTESGDGSKTAWRNSSSTKTGR